MSSVIKEIDRDNNGAIDIDEFMEFMTSTA